MFSAMFYMEKLCQTALNMRDNSKIKSQKQYKYVERENEGQT